MYYQARSSRLRLFPRSSGYGTEKGIRVRYNDNRPDAVFTGETALQQNTLLREFVTEEENPGNGKCVLHVEITHPAPVLRDVVLIDTPGIGSTYRHNTEATINFLPQCDAALFVVSTDPPITEVEVAFLAEIKNRVAKLFFVLNKVDYLDEAERGTALAFYRSVLTREAGIDADTRIFAISAKKGLQARQSGNAQAWLESGLAEVFDHLIAFLALEKGRVLKEAIGRKTFAVFTETSLRIRLEIRVLELPLFELESRRALFGTKIAEAQQQRVHAQDILAGDRRRVHAHLEEQIEKCRAPLCERLMNVAGAAIVASPQDPEYAAQQAVSEEIPRLFEREYGRISAMADQEVTALLRDHQERADELFESIRKAASELFEIPYRKPRGERAYEQVRTPYWVGHDWDSTFSVIPAGTLGRILPVTLRSSRARDRLKKQIDILVMRNLENLRWETLQDIDAAFRKFGADLDADLGLAIDATHGAIESAFLQRTRHEKNIAATMNDLHTASVHLEKVMQHFCLARK